MSFISYANVMSLHDWTKISRALPILQRSPRKFFYIDIVSPQHLDRSLFVFVLCFITILDQQEFRIDTDFAMFTSDLNEGVVLQMSPPLHDLERLRTTMVDFSSINKISFHGSRRFICTGSCSATHGNFTLY